MKPEVLTSELLSPRQALLLCWVLLNPSMYSCCYCYCCYYKLMLEGTRYSSARAGDTISWALLDILFCGSLINDGYGYDLSIKVLTFCGDAIIIFCWFCPLYLEAFWFEYTERLSTLVLFGTSKTVVRDEGMPALWTMLLPGIPGADWFTISKLLLNIARLGWFLVI